MKTLFIDIETTPNLVYTWGLYGQDIALSQLVEPSRVLCFAAKFLEEDEVFFFSEWMTGHDGMIRAAHVLLDEADVVVGYNSDSFDLKRLNAEFISLGLKPPAPYQTVDLYLVTKKNFKFVSHKLENVLKELSLPGKVSHRGFSLWTDTIAGLPEARQEMERYCRGDVHPSLEEAYKLLLPWIPAIPNQNLYENYSITVCPRCGSPELQRRGYRYTSVSKFQRYMCTACGGWSTEGKRVGGATVRGT